MPEPLQFVFREYDDNLTTPFTGLTSDGIVRSDLFPLSDTGLSTAPIADAGRAYLSSLDESLRHAGTLPIDSNAWRAWINAFAPRPPHGLLLDDLTQPQRDAAMAVLRAAMSLRGFEEVRNTMRTNAALSEIAPGYEDTLREWMYWFTVFGQPSVDQPWGVQLYGHHACVNIFIVGGQITISPIFLGAEPRVVEGGRFAGTRNFDQELELGIAVMESFDVDQRKVAVLSESVQWKDLPPELAHPTEGRMRGAVARDNAIVPLDGINGSDLTGHQRELLLRLVSHYVGRLPDAHARLKMAAIREHLDQTNFAWAGVPDVAEPFYYKVHSPVIFIELDAHTGIFLSNDDPQPFHIHTIIRTPNGNDYGRAHLEQFRQKQASAGSFAT
ncbi:DUF3500 domain-containing protein [Rhodococcus wratislaviensis]|uniref:DUF3500 domain-containing protein n=1 Tax=Rhodococcus wratislaviensis TaxID=44752 RepID=UPI003650367A